MKKVFLVLLIAIIIFSVVFIYNKREESPSQASVEVPDLSVCYNGEQLESGQKITLLKGKENKFLIENCNQYQIKIIPYLRFEFNKNGVASMLEENQDVSGAFDLKKNNDGFSITLTNDFNTKTFLQNLYPDKKITCLTRYTESSMQFWEIVIKKGNAEFKIPFGLSVAVENISIIESISF